MVSSGQHRLLHLRALKQPWLPVLGPGQGQACELSRVGKSGAGELLYSPAEELLVSSFQGHGPG